MSILTLHSNPSLQGLARILPNVIYSTASGTPLQAALLLPWNEAEGLRPAFVFVQGSTWTYPDINRQIPQLSAFAQAGYVVMTITHRNRLDGHPFPAFLQDVKCAIRYLRANAQRYGIDPERIGIFGNSSGGNAALLAAMTGDDPRYKSEEYSSYSDRVCCMVECYAPTWLEKMVQSETNLALISGLNGERPMEEVMWEMSPCCIAEAGKDYPPMLLLHGDADTLVPYEQAVLFHDRLRALGKETRLIRVLDAPHGESFWSREVFRHILSFMDTYLL